MIFENSMLNDVYVFTRQYVVVQPKSLRDLKLSDWNTFRCKSMTLTFNGHFLRKVIVQIFNKDTYNFEHLNWQDKTYTVLGKYYNLCMEKQRT